MHLTNKSIKVDVIIPCKIRKIYLDTCSFHRTFSIRRVADVVARLPRFSVARNTKVCRKKKTWLSSCGPFQKENHSPIKLSRLPISFLFFTFQLSVCLLKFVGKNFQVSRQLIFCFEFLREQHQISGGIVNRHVRYVEPLSAKANAHYICVRQMVLHENADTIIVRVCVHMCCNSDYKPRILKWKCERWCVQRHFNIFGC